MDDAAFDDLLPPDLGAKAAVHFTPAAVAREAAALLVGKPDAWVLDVGAAVGKFCLIAAAATPGATFVGIERRHALVRVAQGLARRLALPNVTFVHGDATEVEWARFDAFYLYNPFTEHVPNTAGAFDDALELDPGYFDFYVDFVHDQLAAARAGTRVVTYHGYGGPRPDGYTLGHRAGELELWIKA